MNDRPPEAALSTREQALIDLASEGLTDQAIAKKLGISVATVGTYWGRVRIKIGPYSRTELVAKVIRREQQAQLEALRKENEHLVRTVREVPPVLGADSWQDVLADAPDAIFIVGKEGGITYANQAAAALFGYPREELTQLLIADLVPEDLRTRHRGHIAEYMGRPETKRMGEHMTTPALHRNGSIFDIQATLARITSAESLRVMCCIRKVEKS